MFGDDPEVSMHVGELALLVERTEAAAYADLLAAAPAEWKCTVEDAAGGTLLLAPRVDVLLFNRLIGAGLTRPMVREEIAALASRVRNARVRSFGVQLSPAARPTTVADWLTSAGFVRRDAWNKVYRTDSPPVVVRTDLRIDVAEPPDAAAFARITCAAFGMPAVLEPWIGESVGRAGWRHYICYDGNDAVAVGALYVAGDVGWLGMAGTLPAARRRGAQGALMARRIADGITAGCRWFVTETGEDTAERPNPSLHNMLRAGFVLAYQRPNYLLPLQA